jgi:putative ABC transport system permease protein
MLRATIKGLLAHKLRLALTALAIVLGVTFVSGTLVLTDTLRQTFSSLFGNIYQNIDFVVRATPPFSGNSGAANGNNPPIPESVATLVESVPGVAYVRGGVGGYAQLVAPDGKAIQNGQAPAIGLSFDPNSQLSALRLVSGSPPTTPGEMVVDKGTAEKYHLTVGESLKVLLVGQPQRFTISGLVSFGTADNLAGATITAFDLPTAQRVFDKVGKYDAIDVLAAPGADKAQVQAAIAKVLPQGDEVVTGQTVANEQTSAIDGALSFFSTALLVFAAISLFVGGFTILNTFSIIVGQRTRELALLRIIGASRRQIFRSVIGEALIVGFVSSLLGLGLGVLTAVGLEALLKGFGITLPTGPLVFEGRDVLVALLVGVGVTVLSAISPARRAVRIAPIAAIADHRSESTESSRRRLVAGGAVLLAGIAVLAVGLTHTIVLVGVGAVAIFIGVGMLAPIVARPMSSVLGQPMGRIFGLPGRLGRENSMRNPRRTAQTASALMVGLALVSTMAVLGASISGSATSAVDNAISANYIVTSSGSGAQGFSSTVAAQAAKVAGVTAVSDVYQGAFEVRGGQTNLTAISTDHLAQTVVLRMSSGSGVPALAAGELLVDTTTAAADNLTVGSTVPVKFALTGDTTMKVGGIYETNALLGSYLVGGAFYLRHFETPLAVAVLIQTSGSATDAQTAAIDAGLSSYPGLKIQTKAQFEKAQQQQVNQLLGLVYALLALAIVIALIGIVNTLLLSVFERTREIGLLRAVGMRRRQVKAMIRSEAVILAVFGAIVGVVVGTLLGLAFVGALGHDGINDIVVPFPTLIIFLVISGLLGLGAASWPARRAAKLDVLGAIATD